MKNLKDYTLEDLVQDESFQRYVRDGSEADRVIWEEFLKLYPEKEQMLQEGKAVIDQLYVKIPPQEFSEELTRFRSVIEADKTIKTGKPSTKSTWRYVAAAAISAIVLIPLLITTNKTSVREPDAISNIERSTAKGQRAKLLLKDSTMVKMNTQSSLIYPGTFAADSREVYLKGEAFFDVKRDENRPFIVHVGNLDVRVLGTSFNIRFYPEEETLDVSLVSGKVEVIRNDSVKLTLSPNTEAVLNRSTGQLTMASFDPYYKLAWKENIIRFNKASFEEIVNELEHWYGVEFIYDQHIVSDGFTGEFENMSLENILSGISHSLGFEFEIKGQQIKIFTK
ncbi:FecR family protein [Fulvivirgaceae bacterium BMA12]|uniref:FecR family protein n=1 Tax=Agaribacillus aureus TaxID=3051825 RepID=A0ABT8KY97_9BACT|nr:FecR family protein [Fulvivirgaceae bacterium BMA12]